MFNRNNSPAPTPEESTKADGKGRPTPTRKEAQAAAKQRAKAVIDPKSRTKEQRVSQAARAREAMRTGDDRYLPARDQGPVKRFVRDWIDARISAIEFVLPLFVVILFLGFSRSQSTRNLGAILQIAALLLVLIEGSWVVVGVRRAVLKKFPDASTKGLAFYALIRAMNVRFLRMPKTQVGPGGKPKIRR
ncbi:MAG: hypothetical protein NVSMB48_21380 [Marmoricola sp.]